jgi:hypothetical protein
MRLVHRKGFHPQMNANKPGHIVQLLNHLKAIRLHHCLLLNCGKARLRMQRIAHDT